MDKKTYKEKLGWLEQTFWIKLGKGLNVNELQELRSSYSSLASKVEIKKGWINWCETFVLLSSEILSETTDSGG
jgi:hypothetical protein